MSSFLEGLGEAEFTQRRVQYLCRSRRTVNIALVRHRSIRDLPLGTVCFTPTCVHKHGRVENLFLARGFCAFLTTARVFVFWDISGFLCLQLEITTLVNTE